MNKIKKKVLKKIDSGMSKIHYGPVVFGIGLLIAIIGALTFAFGTMSPTANKILTGALMIFGVILGVTNINSKESVRFLVSAIVIVMLIGPFMGNLMQTFSLGETGAKLIGQLFKNLIGLIGPASIIVALKTLFITAKDEE